VPAGVPVRFQLHGELNWFLEPARRNHEFTVRVGLTDTVKHAVESLGIPHTEIGRILINGEPASWSQPMREGDLVDVFPHATPIELTEWRFVLDGHLGRLAAYLRMLGFDTWYDRSAEDPLLASVATGENRLLLTRDVGLLKRGEVERGYLVRSTAPLEQLREVWERYALAARARPFTRCMACNGKLRAAATEEVKDLLPPRIRETKTEFSRCTECGRVFWRGSHYARMLGWIEGLKRR
jgi:uncharacterized protein with PIN domain